MISINQYIKLIADFFKSHNQINTVDVGNEFNFNAESNIVYPVAHFEYLTQNIQDKNVVHQFEVTLADLFDPNIPNAELAIWSDMNLIADDMITYFANQYDADYDINENVNIQKFSNGNVDRIAGCVFVVSFSQFREANSCIIPTEDNIDNSIGSFDAQFTSELQ
ncbi:hypothetical protein [Mucilaginibacter kameinonensis]|uniref:hypothetical protein n=1 Tax=Mucilaginibacter kameinonensis TaxID=452286 RepID=UPI000EF78525|nr:hypothetical protein [Mucilaginibacter kameinonensis]